MTTTLASPATRVTRAMSVRLPWSPAIIVGGKTPENRGRMPGEAHRGKLVAVHVPTAVTPAAVRDHRITRWLQCHHTQVWTRIRDLFDREPEALKGMVIGVVRFAGWHHALPGGFCCPDWGDREYGSGRPAVHIDLADPVPFRTPVGPFPGKLPVPWKLGDTAADRVTDEYHRSVR